MKRAIVLFVTLLLTLPLLANGPESPTTVILVRHAEKDAAVSPTDPPLTAAGKARAEALVHALRDSGITTVYTTPFHRTRDTAGPIAAALGLQPVELAAGKTFAAETAALLREKHAGETVLVVGHSNTTPDLARALGASDVPSIADPWEFDNIFIVTFRGDEKPHFVRVRYGAISTE